MSNQSLNTAAPSFGIKLNGIPASHRGRLTSVLGVAQGILLDLFNVGVGKAYDAFDQSGAHVAWMIVLGAAGLSTLLALWLVRLDRRVYPKLYHENADETAVPEQCGA